MRRTPRSAAISALICLFWGIFAVSCARSSPPQSSGSDNANPPPKSQDYALHDPTPGIDCDVLHAKIPQSWGVEGHVQWNVSVWMPGKWYLCAANLTGPQLWIRYPAQAFVWRDNFNLLGINFQPQPGDADPAYGDEIQQPVASATDCIKQIILPRYRKDIPESAIISTTEMSAADALTFADNVAGDVMNSPAAKQIQITPKAATMRVQYTLAGRTVQEDFSLLALYLDLPTNQGVVHVWTIPYCTSFRAEIGKLDDEKGSTAKAIDASITLDAKWSAQRDDRIKQAAQTYGDKLRALAQLEESDAIANMNKNIYDTCQQNFHRRMDMEQQAFHTIDNAIAGQSDYVTPDGQTLQAPITPLGQTAWRDGSGQVKFFAAGTNPNGSEPGTYQQLTEK